MRSAAKGAVRGAGEVGGDVAGVARKAVEGTIEAAREIGADVGDLATKAAEGAIEAADRVGSAAGRAVRDTLAATVAGAKQIVPVAPDPAGRGGDASRREAGPEPAPLAQGSARREGVGRLSGVSLGPVRANRRLSFRRRTGCTRFTRERSRPV